ncbi:hypothetical protein FIU93_16165 [Labrenzia sp. THAF35]|nr:hypothetical protein FIU93_16165 [Labrenzia sp. THAF35]
MVVKAIVAVKSTAKNVCIFHVISNSIFKNDINLISTTYSITSVTSIFDDLSGKAANLDGQQDGGPDGNQESGVVAQLQLVAERLAVVQPLRLPAAAGRLTTGSQARQTVGVLRSERLLCLFSPRAAMRMNGSCLEQQRRRCKPGGPARKG